MGMNKERIFERAWDEWEAEEIRKAVEYINTLPLTEEQFKKLEVLFLDIAEEYFNAIHLTHELDM